MALPCSRITRMASYLLGETYLRTGLEKGILLASEVLPAGLVLGVLRQRCARTIRTPNTTVGSGISTTTTGSM